MWQQIIQWYSHIQKWTKPLNESKLLAGILIVLINISSKLVDVRLSRPLEAYFRHTFSRHALVFAMAWMPTRDVVLSLIVSLVAIFVIDHLTNDGSPWCALSENFTGIHLEKEKARLEKERKEKELNIDNSENIGDITKEDIDRALVVMERMRAISSGTPTPIDKSDTSHSKPTIVRAANMGGVFSW